MEQIQPTGSRANMNHGEIPASYGWTETDGLPGRKAKGGGSQEATKNACADYVCSGLPLK